MLEIADSRSTPIGSAGEWHTSQGADLMPRQSQDPLKIAIIGSRGFPSTYGGYETLVRHAARQWVAAGHDVTVYCRDPIPGRRGGLVEGVRCVRTPGIETTSASTLSFGLTAHLHAAFQKFDAALVLNIANGYFLPLLAAAGIPTVVNTDGLEWQRGKWGRVARRVFYQGAKLSARYADCLVSDSEAIADVWEAEFGVKPSFIPYGAPVTTLHDDGGVRELGLQPRKYVLCVARLIPENNVELTLNALERLGSGCRAVVVGSGNYSPGLEARLRQMNEAGKLLWLGHLHDQELLSQLWAHSGVYVHGHSVGGTNPALLQALGLGAPTLALDTTFNREVLRADEQLYSHEPLELALKIEGVLHDGPLQNRWAARGRQTIGDRYQWPTVCDAYERILRRAMERVRQSREPSRLPAVPSGQTQSAWGH